MLGEQLVKFYLLNFPVRSNFIIHCDLVRRTIYKPHNCLWGVFTVQKGARNSVEGGLGRREGKTVVFHTERGFSFVKNIHRVSLSIFSILFDSKKKEVEQEAKRILK